MTYFLLEPKTYRPQGIGRLILVPSDQREHVSSQVDICLMGPGLTSGIDFSRGPVNEGGWISLYSSQIPSTRKTLLSTDVTDCQVPLFSPFLFFLIYWNDFG